MNGKLGLGPRTMYCYVVSLFSVSYAHADRDLLNVTRFGQHQLRVELVPRDIFDSRDDGEARVIVAA